MHLAKTWLVLLALTLVSCGGLVHHKKAKPDEPSMPDANGDEAFQAFLGQLRKAAAAHDPNALAPLMTTNFGFRLNTSEGSPEGEGEGVFLYWEGHKVWPELLRVVQQGFVPQGNYMVAPPEFAQKGADFHGYRAGATLINGSWRLAYFVTD